MGARYWDELTSAWEKIYLNEEEPAAALAAVKERVKATSPRSRSPIDMRDLTAGEGARGR